VVNDSAHPSEAATRDAAATDGGTRAVRSVSTVAIAGSGFAGLGAAMRLRNQGIDFVVLERAGEVGGTWRDNTYPGCACDVESYLYSFSFMPSAQWTQWYSPQPEIQTYLQRCARDSGVLEHIRFHHEVCTATWDGAQWQIETNHGTFTAQFFIMATGPLSDPAMPVIETFRGKIFHSARWDHAYELTNKRVAVIGTGASAIQFVPEIQTRVAKLHLFQRTPPWVLPRLGCTIPLWQRRLFHALPWLQRLERWRIYLYRELTMPLFRHPAMMRRVQRLALWNLNRAIKDPQLREKLTPRYVMGCKRILLSSKYYPALARPNVEVVTSGIAEYREHSIVDGDGIEREVDAILLGTGFRPTEPPLGPFIRGRNGVTLAALWNGSPRAHLGTTIAGLPNFFILPGPNTGTGHTSLLCLIEPQVEHSIAAIRWMHANGISAIEPREDVQAAFNAQIDERMQGTVWMTGGCASWYIDRTGRNSTLWPDFTWKFRRRAMQFDEHEYVCT
jgi:cation diffusion facilitator CzcD-associated flavoprotein CzcO